MKKRFMNVILALSLSLTTFVGCNGAGQNADVSDTTVPENTVENVNEETPKISEETENFPSNDIVILYTNDTHTYINNESKDEEGNVIKGLSFASVKYLKDEIENEGKDVLLVDAGDHVQGTALGGMDEGESVVKIMNETGYDVAVPGNHEFDYGMFRFFALSDMADYSYISCNFYMTENNETVFSPYQVFDVGGVKVAIVGISTPDSITSSTPASFMDETGENFIYNFYSGSDGSEMYEAFQKAVDAAREEADYVIGLGHLGDDLSSNPYRSTDLISHISGIDAFIDGHSHSELPCEIIKDSEGNDVILSQTGCYFNSVGKLTIGTDGSIKTELVKEIDGRDEKVDELTSTWVDEVNETLGEKIAVLDTPLYIMNANNPDERLIRRQETNLGDFVADAAYYYFNEVANEPVDVAFNNGGGIRSNLEEGDLTYLSAKTVAPFGNVMCVIEATGSQILDALELGAAVVGQTDESGNQAEFGGFMQTAGLQYTIDTTKECTISVSEEGVWKSGPSGEYRVGNVEIYNKETGEYEPLDLNKTYRVGGINYTLRNQGDGMSMFKDCKCVVDYVQEDYLVLAEYMKAFAKEDGVPKINTENSPLSSYEGYLLDYDNPLGAGRIKIIVR